MTAGVSLEKQKKEIYAMVPYFENVVIIGDSLAESILDFRLLRKHNVVAKRGRSVDMIDDDLNKVMRLTPRVLIMVYGKNDISHFDGNANTFMEIYKEKVQYIRTMLPDTEVYINSLIPMHPDQMKRIGGIAKIIEFNEALQEMCQHVDIGFIDNMNIMTWSENQFEYDGIHPKYPYYPKWLRNIAYDVGLIEWE